MSERKRKKARYSQATHQRHDDLLRQSLRQFLVYTDHTKQRRQALFLHQQVYVGDNALSFTLHPLLSPLALSRSKCPGTEVSLQVADVRSKSSHSTSRETENSRHRQDQSTGSGSIR